METRWLYTTSEDFPNLVEASKGVCVIPMGCVEKHGLHLPLGQDIIQVSHLAYMASQLDTLLPGSNIRAFSRRFHRMTIKNDGNGVFNFIFNQPDMQFKLQTLPENTRLEKTIKTHYLQGKAIYGMVGYFTVECR